MTAPAPLPQHGPDFDDRPQWEAVEPVADQQLWSVLAQARAAGAPAVIAAAEDAVFRCYRPMAAAMAAAAAEAACTDRPAGVQPSAAAELEQAAELGLAQAVLAWRRADGVGFTESARRSVGHRLRIATVGGWTATGSAVSGPMPTQREGSVGDAPMTRPTARAGGRHSTEVAMLDRAGVIISVNDAWREFCAANGGNGSRTGVGMSYLAVCDAAGDDMNARQAAAAIRAAASGDLPGPVNIVVPCHAPAVLRWYDMLVSPRLDRRFRTVGVAVTLTLRAARAVH